MGERGGLRAESYDREKAWPSISHSILYGVHCILTHNSPIVPLHYTCHPLKYEVLVLPLIQKNLKFASYIRKFRREGGGGAKSSMTNSFLIYG